MDTLAQTIPPIIPAEPVAATPWTRSRFRVDEPIDPAKVSGRGYGSLLLYYREAVFDKIHRSEKLDEMIRYYAQHSIGFAALFGALLGFFTFNLQIISGAIKIPLLLWGTLGICLPALFTFNVLLGSKLSLKQTAAVLSMSTYLLSTVMASLSPILLLFAISSREKSFTSFCSVFCLAPRPRHIRRLSPLECHGLSHRALRLRIRCKNRPAPGRSFTFSSGPSSPGSCGPSSVIRDASLLSGFAMSAGISIPARIIFCWTFCAELTGLLRRENGHLAALQSTAVSRLQSGQGGGISLAKEPVWNEYPDSP